MGKGQGSLPTKWVLKLASIQERKQCLQIRTNRAMYINKVNSLLLFWERVAEQTEISG